MEGFLGAGNYGVSRMNGGFANRPGLSISPPGCIGAHVMRDLKRLIAIRDEVLEKNTQFDQEGLALVWLRPWTGTSSLQATELDPYFIEICRRVRLVPHGGGISALAAGSKVARIAIGKDAKGLTGDPWTPIEIKDGESKALTVDARGFSYRRMSDILFEKGFQQAQLQQIGPTDRQGCSYLLICRALARGHPKSASSPRWRASARPTPERRLAMLLPWLSTASQPSKIPRRVRRFSSANPRSRI
jgi:CRISPR system Cascade subunit CasA